MDVQNNLPIPGDVPLKEGISTNSITEASENALRRDDDDPSLSPSETLQEELEILERQSPLPPEFRELKPVARLVGLSLIQGKTQKEISEALHLSENTVGKWARRPIVKAFIDHIVLNLQNKIIKIFESSAVSAARTISELTKRADKDSVRLQAALAIVERYLGKVPDKHQHLVMTYGDLVNELQKKEQTPSAITIEAIEVPDAK